MIFNKKLTHTT